MTVFENIGFSLIALLIVFGFLVSLPDAWNIISWYCEKREKKEAKQHPDFIAELIEFEEEQQNCIYLGILVDETKREVDALLVKINYAPMDKKSELIEQCEETKKLLFDYEEHYQMTCKELANKREELDRKRKELGLRWN